MNILKEQKIRKLYDKMTIKTIVIFAMLISEKQITTCFIAQDKIGVFTSIMTLIESLILFFMAVNILTIHRRTKQTSEDNNNNRSEET